MPKQKDIIKMICSRGVKRIYFVMAVMTWLLFKDDNGMRKVTPAPLQQKTQVDVHVIIDQPSHRQEDTGHIKRYSVQ